MLRSGMPKPLHLALFVARFRREVRAPFPPAWMVRALMSPLAAIARMRGHHERYALAAAYGCARRLRRQMREAQVPGACVAQGSH